MTLTETHISRRISCPWLENMIRTLGRAPGRPRRWWWGSPPWQVGRSRRPALRGICRLSLEQPVIKGWHIKVVTGMLLTIAYYCNKNLTFFSLWPNIIVWNMWLVKCFFFKLFIAYCIRNNFHVQIFLRFWTRCGNLRGLNFTILLMKTINRHKLKWKFLQGSDSQNSQK